MSHREVVVQGEVVATTVRKDSFEVRKPDGTLRHTRFLTAVVTVRVDRIWKGDVGRTLVVETKVEIGACGVILNRGDRYLIDATRYEGTLRTGQCSWTGTEQETATLVALLRAS